MIGMYASVASTSFWAGQPVTSSIHTDLGAGHANPPDRGRYGTGTHVLRVLKAKTPQLIFE